MMAQPQKKEQVRNKCPFLVEVFDQTPRKMPDTMNRTKAGLRDCENEFNQPPRNYTGPCVLGENGLPAATYAPSAVKLRQHLGSTAQARR